MGYDLKKCLSGYLRGIFSGDGRSRTAVQTTLITRITCVSFLLHQLVSSSIQIVLLVLLRTRLIIDEVSTLKANLQTTKLKGSEADASKPGLTEVGSPPLHLRWRTSSTFRHSPCVSTIHIVENLSSTNLWRSS